MAAVKSPPAPPPAPAQPAPSSDELFDEFERRAWLPPEQISVPEWAEKYRYLSRRQSSRVGRWRNPSAPHVIGIMRMADRPGVEQLNILKCSQGSASEALRSCIGKWAHLDADPMLLVLPDKDTGKAIIHHRIIPLFEDTEVLRQLATGRRWDKKNNELSLNNGFTLRLGFSGSIASVASHPARRVICDERSKFQSDGRVSIADSIAARTTTYEHPLVVNISSPGPEPDPTTELYEASQIKLQRFMACPHCGRYQVLTLARLKWEPTAKEEPDKSKRAAIVVDQKSAWIECENPTCNKRITDAHKRQLALAGYWATPDQGWKLYDDGREEGQIPKGTRVGMHVPAFVTLEPKHRLYKIAEQYILALGSIEALTGFYNETLGEVFRETVVNTTTSAFARKCRPNAESGFAPGKAMVIPAWASRLLLTVDTQKDHFYFVLRAWGQAMRSRRIHHGRVLHFEELDELFYRTRFPYENNVFPALGCWMCGIDSGGGKMGLPGSRTDEVYTWCNRDPARLKPLKGESEPRDQPIRWRRVTYEPPDRKRSPYVVFLHLIDSGHFNDILAGAIEQTLPHVNTKTGEVEGEVDQWELNDADDDEYNRHMSAVHKVRVRSRGRPIERWIPKSTGARHDYRDTEKYQFAMAQIAGFAALPSPEQLVQQRKLEEQANRQTPRGITMPDGRPFLATRR